MRSRRECVRWVAAALLTMWCSFGGATSGYQAPIGESIGDAEITRALEKAKADPNLATERTIKTLRWKNKSESKPFHLPQWFRWIVELFVWVGESARVLVWIAAITLVAWLIVYITRIVQKRQSPTDRAAAAAPSHVRDLDIRPETLPADIGSAARALWETGQHRAALALLYRGMLSRLVHVHQVPIRDSTTEGDCLELASAHLAQPKNEYASRLVRAWQRFVYGGETIQAPIVYALFDDFAAALDSAATFDSVPHGGQA